MREGWHPAYQVRLLQARHLAKRRVDISNASRHVQRAHTGQHRIFHGTAKVGFLDQRLLRLHAAAGVSPSAQQHPDCQRAQGAYQPEKTAAHDAQRRPVALRPYQQPVAHGRNRNFVFGGTVRPRQQPHRRAAWWRQITSQYIVFIVQQAHRIFGGDFSRYAKAQQTINGVFAHDDTAKFALVVKRYQNL